MTQDVVLHITTSWVWTTLYINLVWNQEITICSKTRWWSSSMVLSSRACSVASALHRTTLLRQKIWSLLLLFGAVSKQPNMPILFRVKEPVAHWCVFNFWTTMELYSTQEYDISDFLVSRMSSLLVWLCTWDLLTTRKTWKIASLIFKEKSFNKIRMILYIKVGIKTCSFYFIHVVIWFRIILMCEGVRYDKLKLNSRVCMRRWLPFCLHCPFQAETQRQSF